MSSIPTVGFDNINNSFQLSDGSIVSCHIFDTAGQERYRALNFQYYKKADAVLLVYDISKRASFENVKNYYISQIKEKCKEDIVILLLGNKADKENEREVSIDEGVNLASQEEYEFKETSCLQNMYVADAFEYLVENWNLLNEDKPSNLNKNEPTNQNQNEPKYRTKRSNTVVSNQMKTNFKFKEDNKQKKISRCDSFKKTKEEQEGQETPKNIVLTAEKTILLQKNSHRCCQ